MAKVRVKLSIGYPSATHTDVIEIDDDLTDKEIGDAVRDWAENYIEIDWEVVAT